MYSLRIRPHKHYPLTEHAAKEPTTNEDGNKAYWECDICHKKFWDQFGFVEITDDSWRIPATGSSTRNSERYSGSGSSSGGGGGSGSGGGGIIGAGILAAAPGEWVKDNIGWRYKYLDGSYATGSSTNDANGNPVEKIAWIKINNGDFAFGSDSYLKTGWTLDNTDGNWYYCDENNGRLYGWYYDTADGYWYYLDANTGSMLTGWQLVGGKQYYFATAPAAATYTFDPASSKWVYSNAAHNHPYGAMYAGTTTPDNQSVGADGAKIG